jgi:uncharacterized membrane protein
MGYKSIDSPILQHSSTRAVQKRKVRYEPGIEPKRKAKSAAATSTAPARGDFGFAAAARGYWLVAGRYGMYDGGDLQTGIVKHLPDPPMGNFDSDRVNSSDTAYRLGAPDGSISLASLAANIPIAAFGGVNRVQTKPWVPLVAALKAAGEALAASWYFYQMPAKEKAWCGYCIVGALANIGIAVLTIPEARKAIAVLMSETTKAQ